MAAPDLEEIANALLACVCEALEAAERPVCTCTTTVGTPMASTACSCPSGPGEGELFVSFLTMYPVDADLDRVNAVFPCRSVTMGAEFGITLLRCFPTLTERGELPSADEQADAAAKLHADVQDMWHALRCCAGEIGHLRIDQVNVPDPEAGLAQVSFVVVVETSVKPTPPAPPRPDESGV